MEPTASQVRHHYSQKNQEAHLERALARALQKTANLIPNQMFELPSQPSSIVLEIANVRDIILKKQDDDDTDLEIG
jgi:hypothetical protein